MDEKRASLAFQWEAVGRTVVVVVAAVAVFVAVEACKAFVEDTEAPCLPENIYVAFAVVESLHNLVQAFVFDSPCVEAVLGEQTVP